MLIYPGLTWTVRLFLGIKRLPNAWHIPSKPSYERRSQRRNVCIPEERFALIGFELTVCRQSTSAGPDTGQEYHLGDLDKLPAEIRNEIYKHALTTEAPLRISRSHHGAGICIRHDACVRIAHSKRFCFTVTTLTVPKRTRKVQTPARKVIQGGFLRVSKAIHKESTPILYRGNSFDFDTTQVLHDFFRKSPVNAPLLAYIKLNRALIHARDLDVLGNIEDPKQVLAPSYFVCTYNATLGEMTLDAWRAVALKPFIQQFSARAGSSRVRRQIASVQEQLQRLDTIHVEEVKGRGKIKKERESMAEFRELMVREIYKDSSEAAKKEIK